MKRQAGIKFFVAALFLSLSPANAQQSEQGAAAAQAGEQAAPVSQPKTVEEELMPRPELGDRSIDVLSEAAQKMLRESYLANSNRVMPPVPIEQKKMWFQQLMSMSAMSMRDLFNMMTSKLKVDAGISFDDVIEAMDLKANDVNFKKVGHNKFWKDVSAISGIPALRVEILQYCDAAVGRRMLDYSPEFVIFIPCRIAVIEDPSGDIWLMTMDWDVSWLAMAWHPDSKLNDQLKNDAVRIRDAMEQIMQAGAKGEW
jgi:uncharacterized protein (DUF302 family)